MGDRLVVLCNDASGVRHDELAGKAKVIEAPFLSLTSLRDRLRFRLSGKMQEWHDDRESILDRNSERVLSAIIRQEKPDVAYVEYGTTLARCAATLTAHNIPIVAHLHGADITTQLAAPNYARCLEQGMREAKFVVTASHHIRRLAILAGAHPESIKVVHLGVDLEGIEPFGWASRKSMPRSIVFLGRMVPKKNPVALVEAFSLVHKARTDTTLHMIGDGPERARAEERGRQLGIDSAINWHGAIARSDALEIMRDKWIYAQHSVTPFTGDQEGFGISIAEASALELPVVSTRHNGIPEQVAHGENGFLVSEYDFEAMAGHLLNLLASPELCERMGATGRKNVLQKYVRIDRAQSIFRLISDAARFKQLP